jgi:hypothetical protein
MPERRRQALAMISAIDDGVGQIMETLRAHGLEEKTLIFFIGDNGAPLKIHKLDAPGGGPGWDGSLNDPLNGEKGMLAEGGIRVPFLVYWKGHIEGGQLFHHPVISLDVAATAVALAGLPEDPKLDGVNLVPYLRGRSKGAPHEALYWRWIAQSAIREGKWKYLRGGDREYLFNVEVDREEKRNLLEENPEIASRLKTRLQTWSMELSPPGLTTKKMSATWERYYDYYLDGKPAPKLKPVRRTRQKSIKGWIARNSTAEVKDGVLEVRLDAKTRQRPFIVTAGLELPGKLTAIVRLRTEKAGVAGFAWREKGQKDFPISQTVKFDCRMTTEIAEHRVTIPAGGKVIHVRLLLPEHGADVASIEF